MLIHFQSFGAGAALFPTRLSLVLKAVARKGQFTVRRGGKSESTLQAGIMLVLLFERLLLNAYPHYNDLMLSRGLDTVDDSAIPTSA
jgi:hypothetical protein